MYQRHSAAEDNYAFLKIYIDYRFRLQIYKSYCLIDFNYCPAVRLYNTQANIRSLLETKLLIISIN